jgi:hypothetical protein
MLCMYFKLTGNEKSLAYIHKYSTYTLLQQPG